MIGIITRSVIILLYALMMIPAQASFDLARNPLLSSDPVRIVLLGGPGAGKGTQSELIKEHFGVKHMSTGDILRAEAAAGTDLGEYVSELMKKGKLVEDETMFKIIRRQLSELGEDEGFILDGFPRTLNQAKFLDETLKDLNMPLTGVLNFMVDDETIVKRICGRWTHPSSGRSYHEEFANMQPKKMEYDSSGKVIAAWDDVTGEPLVKRADDNEVAVRSRLFAYHENSRAVIDFYKYNQPLIYRTVKSYDKETTWQIVKDALEGEKSEQKALSRSESSTQDSDQMTKQQYSLRH